MDIIEELADLCRKHNLCYNFQIVNDGCFVFVKRWHTKEIVACGASVKATKAFQKALLLTKIFFNAHFSVECPYKKGSKSAIVWLFVKNTRENESIFSGRLSERLKVGRSTVNKVLLRMKEQGYVSRNKLRGSMTTWRRTRLDAD